MNKLLKRINSITMVILLLVSLCVPVMTVQAKKDVKQKVIVIDPGCQAIENNSKNSIGPGEWNRVSEDMVGAKGAVTNNNEYEINLQVALKVTKRLTEAGYKVELTRTKNDVDITNPDRAMVANTLNADLFISIHASSTNKDDQGVAVVCATEDNPYNLKYYRNSRLLADTLLGSLVEKTAVEKYKVYESDDLMGINWCTVTNVVVELGNMNNPDDDQKLADEEYQNKLADGIVAGIDSYFSQK